MDRRDVERADLATSLRDLAAVNRWLGGERTASRLVLGIAKRIPERPVTVLDVGTGGADIPRELVLRARRADVSTRVLATDIHPLTLQFAEQAVEGIEEIEVRHADALTLPFGDRHFHIVMCNTMLHHFARDEAVQLLREMNRVASRAVVVTDLARSGAALLGARLLAATVWRSHPITRHDGPVSVRAAFTRRELSALMHEALGPGAIVRGHPIFRLSAVSDLTSAAP